MGADEARDAPVRAKALLVDPAAMTVLWANESVVTGPGGSGEAVGRPLEDVIPLAGQLGIPLAVQRVIATGEPFHVHADVIPTRRGSMVLAVSVYRLPGGDALVLIENAWEHMSRSSADDPGRPARRRR